MKLSELLEKYGDAEAHISATGLNYLIPVEKLERATPPTKKTFRRLQGMRLKAEEVKGEWEEYLNDFGEDHPLKAVLSKSAIKDINRILEAGE